MNNNFTVVDEVKQEKGGTATLFVKSGDDFVRVATNVQKDDGLRAIGTVLDPKGKPSRRWGLLWRSRHPRKALYNGLSTDT
ncbi:Cache 3/Cache 2 fusion domain-containing protein [Paraburkholderia sp. PGU19]|uniref:Cache 3/Cache 2 fusion domain-containing protein n=1 Tax=Paraburkholderia sp. PGU19 TaxID=2735434 RepID=UPI00237B5670|nr:Cache 3/Cache 2 fusion domain-containing protein [Paraburkholderia sp. PGU19]